MHFGEGELFGGEGDGCGHGGGGVSLYVGLGLGVTLPESPSHVSWTSATGVFNLTYW